MLPSQPLGPSQLHFGHPTANPHTASYCKCVVHSQSLEKRAAEQLTPPREPLFKQKAAMYMQSLICHVQKSFTTIEEAAAKKQMPIGSMEELILKPSHVHRLSNKVSVASPEEAGKREAFPLCKKGMFPKVGAEGGCLEKVQREGGRDGEEKGSVGRKEETGVK